MRNCLVIKRTNYIPVDRSDYWMVKQVLDEAL